MSMTMLDQVPRRLINGCLGTKNKLTGAKPPLRPKHVWSVWTTFQVRRSDVCRHDTALAGMLRSSSQLKRMRPSDRADLVVNQQHGIVFGSESILVHV